MQSEMSSPVTVDPEWPDGDGPYLFVIEVSGPLERSLLRRWIDEHRPSHVGPGEVQVVHLPTTRRSAGRRRRDPALAAFLHADDDSLVVPLRVAWLATSRGGKRSVGWIDLAKLGDPRDPDPVRQYVIHAMSPDRVRVVLGQPERSSILRETWATEEALREGRSFVEEVAHRAWLSLERAERRLRGTRYKVPKFPIETLVRSREFQAGVAGLARSTGVSFRRMSLRTRRYVGEIAATHSPYMIDLVTGGFRWLIGKAYVELNYDEEELAGLYQLGQRHPLVFLPTHKSHFDHQSLQFALYENGLPPNHTAGGINMNFFPVGPLIRRSGVFFIRREFKDNEPYKFVLRRYIDYLLRRRFPLEWYIEGGRSRTGKLLPPRFGMLAYVVESYLRGSTEDVVVIPVSIAYDQVHDVHSYAAEQSGAPKRPETFAWMIRMIRGLQRPYGGIHMRLGAPISLRAFLDELGTTPADADDTKNPAIPKLAFEISNRINEVTPITPISMITLVLLDAPNAALTADEIAVSMGPYVAEIVSRNLPKTIRENVASPDVIADGLRDLEASDIVEEVERPSGRHYRVPETALLAAAYYRNTMIHHFVDRSIAELAVAAALGQDQQTADTILDNARMLRELLLFDFFFPGRSAFDRAIADEITKRCPDWRELVSSGKVDELLDAFTPRIASAVLLPFLDAYRVIADVLDDPDADDVSDSGLVAEAMALGREHVETGVIRSAESISKILFETALKAARHHRPDAAGGGGFIASARRFAAVCHDMAAHSPG